MPKQRSVVGEAPPLRVDLLGGFRVRVADRLIEQKAWRLHKARSLVKLLALAPSHRLGRDEILDLLWPDSEPDAAANCLHRTLHTARRTLNPSAPAAYLPLYGDVLGLSSSSSDDVWVDVDAFADAAASARAAQTQAGYQAALDLYRGDLLPDDRYEDWAIGRREELRTLYLTLLVDLAHFHDAQGELEQTVATLERVVAAEPTHEKARVALMRLYAANGRRPAALRHYHRLTEALQRELDVAPAAATQWLYADITAGRISAASAPAATPIPATTPIPPGATAEPASEEAGQPQLASEHWPDTLPRPSSSFIGRERELHEVIRLLSSTRLLTLTGAGGSGKTRLALQGAAAVHRAHAGGVRLVTLAGATDGTAVEQTVATALGVREEPRRPLREILIAALSAEDALLILDNCEHVLEACRRLAEALLHAAPRLRILATSREPLGLSGETCWNVPSLAYPDPEHLPPIERLPRYDAVALFLARARSARPGFALTSQNASAVVQLCRRLDGIPLALELAAARVHVLSVEEIVARLDNVFAVLARRRQMALPHHRTLRAAIDWSHDLLSEPERVLFRRLAVFAGGWTLDAAEEICGGDERDEVLDVLAQLVDKSLVMAEEQVGAMRYRFLETVRHYALEKFSVAGEAGAIGSPHAAWCVCLAEQAESELTGPRQAQWFNRLETEHDNLRAALAWLTERGEIEDGLRLSGALWRFWFNRRHPSEGRRRLQELLADAERSGAVAPAVRATALSALGSLAFMQGDYAEAATMHERSLALRRGLDDIQAVAGSLNNLGNVAQYQGEYARATAFHEESLALRRRTNDRWGIAISLSNLANIAAEQGRYDRAMQLLEESLELRRESGDVAGIALTVGNLGILARYQGLTERAAALLDESLTLRRRIGDTWGTANALANLGNVAVDRHDYHRALARYQESLTLCREMGDKKVAAYGLEGVAAVACACGDPQRAVRLCSAAAAVREAIGAPLPPPERAIYDQTIAAAHAALGDDAFAAAVVAGRALPLEYALADALAVAASDLPAPARDATEKARPTATGTVSPLSRREQEIVALVAAGRTNRQIAGELGIAERTVDTHVGNILDKLGLSSRGGVAAWAATQADEQATLTIP